MNVACILCTAMIRVVITYYFAQKIMFMSAYIYIRLDYYLGSNFN